MQLIMRQQSYVYLVLILFVFTLNSCVTKKKLSYLSYSGDMQSKDMAFVGGELRVNPSVYKVMPYDNLYISILSPDPKWSEIFNSGPGGGMVTEESAVFQGYSVDIEGFIEIPFVGKVKVIGESLAEIKTKLELTFSSYVKDASIRVRLVNNHVSIVGEVRTPGRYPLVKDRINIFEVLAMAGDLSEYSNRGKIQLIRPTEYGPIVKEFTLSNRSILNSEYYYIMPNDIIYVPPLKGKTFQMNSAIYSILLGVLNSGLVVFALIRNN